MFDSSKKSTGTGYTTTVALLILAFIFSPAAMVFGYIPVVVAIGCSAICAVLAWMSWKRLSQLSIPSIVVQGGREK